MQTAGFRYLVLIVVLLAGAGLYAVFGEPNANTGTPRWPDSETVYAADLWSVGPGQVEHATDAGRYTDSITRTFQTAGGTTSRLTILTSQGPKLYGPGAEVPFLGTGYSVVAAPSDLASLEGTGVNALVAQRGTEQWLVMYAYGERRGLLGNGPLPWILAVLDGVVGQPNDYYKLYLTTRTDGVDPRAGRAAAELARTLFPRIAAWYAA